MRFTKDPYLGRPLLAADDNCPLDRDEVTRVGLVLWYAEEVTLLSRCARLPLTSIAGRQDPAFDSPVSSQWRVVDNLLLTIGDQMLEIGRQDVSWTGQTG